MRTHSPLVLNVIELLENPGVRREFRFDAPAAGLHVGMSAVEGELHFDLTGESIDGGIVIQGTIGGRWSGQCRRCLKDVDRDFSFKAQEIFRPPSEVWEEGYVIKEGTVDLERMVADNVALNLDISPLCREDCKGICPVCGQDRNEVDCGHEPLAQGDHRWDALKQLKGRLNG